MDATQSKPVHPLVRILEDVDGARSYSGRAMYGRRCFALERSLGEVMELIVEACLEGADFLTSSDQEEITRAVRNVRMDSLGLDQIIYFPSVPYETPEVSDDEEE